ncbi:MAG: SpoIIIAH-like family protein [Bacilli bacterium]|nr:SpoIIIAH-like family protein [Bacilli bacterium]MDD4406640.1 SpoIIIAH-like family protein [Bacilli bacterium]
MINKQNLWFLTLFSIILVLSVYYVALPGENLSSLIDTKHSESDKVSTNISENDVLATLRVENDEAVLSEMEDLQSTLLDAKASAEDKNNAYEKLLNINLNKGKESELESLILKTYNLKSFIKIKDDKINVTISAKDNSYESANNIIRTIQKEFDEKMYITVKYQ